MRKRKYQFKMFGGLSVTTDGKTIPLSSQIGKQLTALLSYLICNYKQSVSKEKIIDNFWPDSENPSNALKFAIHRLRKTLETVEGLPNVEMIVTTANGYQFNPTISVELDTEAFEKAVLEAKSDDRIRFVGFVEGKELQELYSNARLFVFPSEAEGMPMCLLEALSYNIPCLVSDIPENIEVGGEYVTSFKSMDISDLKNKLEMILSCQCENSTDLREYVKNNYDWDTVVRKTLKVYKAKNSE